MTVPLIAALGQTFLMLLLGFVAIFLILLVLVQRGRGGGLAGALGGMGGSSAFGAKAGDVFTKITVVAATLWIVLCIVATKMTPSDEGPLDTGVSSTATIEGPKLDVPAGSGEETSDEGEAATEAPVNSSADSSSASAETEPGSDVESE